MMESIFNYDDTFRIINEGKLIRYFITFNVEKLHDTF